MNPEYKEFFLKEQILRTAIDVQCRLKFNPENIPHATLVRVLSIKRWPAFMHHIVKHHQFLFGTYAPDSLLKKFALGEIDNA